jgi:hypothetical protein
MDKAILDWEKGQEFQPQIPVFTRTSFTDEPIAAFGRNQTF